MTFHEHLVKEVLDSFDKGILTRERLELLCNDMLKGDSLFTELYAEHISSKSEQEAVIKFLKKELIHKTCYRQVMKRQYHELKQQMKSDNERHTKMYADAVVDNKRELQRLKLETKKVEKELNKEREKYEFLLHFNSHINEIENPFSKEHFNLTKQAELLKSNPILYEVLSDIARVQAMKKDLER